MINVSIKYLNEEDNTIYYNVELVDYEQVAELIDYMDELEKQND